jgi:hypothetical protein
MPETVPVGSDGLEGVASWAAMGTAKKSIPLRSATRFNLFMLSPPSDLITQGREYRIEINSS